MSFPTSLESILSRIEKVDPEKYGRSRNFKNGAVSKLSPYISRGVISTNQVYQQIKSRNLAWYKIEKFVQELTWRDYWQQVWKYHGDKIYQDLRNVQTPVRYHGIPKAILDANTGIQAVDEAISEFYETGYMHNHMRMYVAAICCNIAQCHWLEPAKWMYAHLLDGDPASNFLSWQWVAGSFSNKKYIANQENINKYFNSEQKGTFLDVTYPELQKIKIPKELNEVVPFGLETKLPNTTESKIENTKTCLYSYFNLDPNWHKDRNIQRILILEPSLFNKNPITEKALSFTLELAQNIPDIKIFCGEFDELNKMIDSDLIIYKEHPTNKHFKGKEESRDWMFHVEGYYPSFFKYWKQCQEHLKHEEGLAAK